MKTKLLIAFVFSLISWGAGYAQLSYVPSTAFRYNAGAGVGFTTVYGDLPVRKAAPAGRLYFDYRVKEFITIGAEAQAGLFSNGVKNAQPTEGKYRRDVAWGLYSQANYISVNINSKVYVGQFNDETEGVSALLNNIYAGLGVGYIMSNTSDVVTEFPGRKEVVKSPVMSSSGITIPLNLGVDVELPVSNLSFNLNYQISFTTSDGLDGYSFTGSNVKDAYGLLCIGLKYHFGPTL